MKEKIRKMSRNYLEGKECDMINAII